MSRIVRPFVAMLLLALPCVAAQPNGTGGVSPSRAAPVADSLPSSAALQVLGRIPEPIDAARELPPPPRRAPRNAPASDTALVNGRPVNGGTPATGTALAAAISSDSTRAPEAGSAGDVPVPAPTQPVGVTPSPTLVMPDTLPPAAATSAAPNPVAPSASEPVVLTGTWCVQVAAPEERAKAVSRRDAAQSLLMLPFVIEHEAGLYKVRTRDTWNREAADAIKQRALGSGFQGVFLVERSASAPPEVAPPAKPAPKSTHKPARRPSSRSRKAR